MSLEGMFAHTFDDQGDVQYQVRVVRAVDDMVNHQGTAWLCQYYSWLTGDPNSYFVITTTEIVQQGWRLYDDAECWADAGTQLSRKADIRRRSREDRPTVIHVMSLPEVDLSGLGGEGGD